MRMARKCLGSVHTLQSDHITETSLRPDVTVLLGIQTSKSPANAEEYSTYISRHIPGYYQLISPTTGHSKMCVMLIGV